jgi:hypothetical protein
MGRPRTLVLLVFPDSLTMSLDSSAIHLSESMILGLLDELSKIENPLFAQFCEILAELPVSKARASSTSRAPSERPYLSGSTASTHLSLDSPSPSSNLPTAASEATSGVTTTGITEGAELDTNTCCRNGVKHTTFGAPTKHRSKHQYAKSGEDVVISIDETAEVGKRLTRGGGGIAVAEDAEDVDGRRRVIGNKMEQGGGSGDSGDVVGLGEDSDVSDEGSEGEDTIGGKQKKKGRRRVKKAKKAKVDTSPAWLTNGTPPDLVDGMDSLVMELTRIISNTGLQHLVDLVQLLIKPVSPTLSDDHPLTLGSLIAACAEQESKQMLADFRHMILLIRLAFHLER